MRRLSIYALPACSRVCARNSGPQSAAETQTQYDDAGNYATMRKEIGNEPFI